MVMSNMYAEDDLLPWQHDIRYEHMLRSVSRTFCLDFDSKTKSKDALTVTTSYPHTWKLHAQTAALYSRQLGVGRLTDEEANCNRGAGAPVDFEPTVRLSYHV